MRFGIRTKAILVPAVILLIGTAVNALIVSARFRSDYSLALKGNVGVIAQKLKLQLERLFQLGIRLNNIEGFDEQCSEILREHPELSYARVTDRSGTVLFHNATSDHIHITVAVPAHASDPQFAAVTDPSGAAFYQMSVPITNSDGALDGWAVVGFPRRLIDDKIRSITVWSIMVAGSSMAITLALLWGSLSGFIIRPISALLRAIHQIRSSGDLNREVQVHSNDEIGDLADSFSGMIHSIRDRDAQIRQNVLELQQARDQLEVRVRERTAALRKANEELQQEIVRRKEAEAVREKLHAELVAASRKAGMADVATGVIHNVGNALNSVNVSANVAAQRLRRSEVGSLEKIAELIKEHKQDLATYLSTDRRGRLLPDFLLEVVHFLSGERNSLVAEMETISSGLEHIKEIIRQQQAHAKNAAYREEVAPAELMETVLKMQLASLERHHIRIVRHFADAGCLPLDKHKVLQILANLISNAKNAVNESEREDKVITLTIQIREQGAERRLCFQVCDNGVGIDAANKAKIFSHGFTTRSDGHGFGLHSAATLAMEMGGQVLLDSDGIGKGATFTLEVPAPRTAPNGPIEALEAA
jgi:signal transduction histidine kinase